MERFLKRYPELLLRTKDGILAVEYRLKDGKAVNKLRDLKIADYKQKIDKHNRENDVEFFQTKLAELEPEERLFRYHIQVHSQSLDAVLVIERCIVYLQST